MKLDRLELVKRFKKDMGKNMMTPHILGYKSKENRVVEISEGRGLENEPIFGVTVKDYVRGEWKDTDYSKLTMSKKEAKEMAEKALRAVV